MLQTAFPEQAPAATKNAVTGVAATPVALPSHGQTRRQDEIQLIIPAEKLLSTDDIHWAGNDPRRGNTGHKRAGTAGDTGQFIDAGDFTQQLRQCPNFTGRTAPAAEQSGEQQGKIRDFIQPLGDLRLNGQSLLRVTSDNDIV